MFLTTPPSAVSFGTYVSHATPALVIGRAAVTPIFETTAAVTLSNAVNTAIKTPIFTTTTSQDDSQIHLSPIFQTTSDSSAVIGTDPVTATPIFLTTDLAEDNTITTAITPKTSPLGSSPSATVDLDSISFVLFTPGDTTTKPTGTTTSNDVLAKTAVLKTTTGGATPTPTHTVDHDSSDQSSSAAGDKAGNPSSNAVIDDNRALVPIMATTVGAAGLYGLYCSLFSFAMFVSLTNAREAKRPTYYLQWTAAVTFILITAHFLLELAYNWPTGALLPDSFYYHVAVMHLILPLCVALLSDGILAWRVFIVWDRKRWIKWTLIGSLSFTFGLGLLGSIKLFIPFFKGPTYHGYAEEISAANTILIVWAWMSFILNSSLSASMLLRIFGIGSRSGRSFGQNGRSRYVAIISSIIQSALISWFGILSCALSWSVKTHVQSPILDAITELKDTDLHTVNYAAFVLVVLPFLLGISQVLLIARTGIARFQHPEHLAKNVFILSNHWDTQVADQSYLEKQDEESSALLNEQDSTLVHQQRINSTTSSFAKSPAASYYESGYHDADWHER